MTESLDRLLMLRDAMDRTRSDPGFVGNWHAVGELLAAVDDPATRRQICDPWLAALPAVGIAGFLRTSFHRVLSDAAAPAAMAAEALLRMRPVAAERIMAFALIEWAVAISHCRTGGAFVAALQGARLAELLALAAGSITREEPPSLVPRSRRPLSRIAVVAPVISQDSHTPTQLALSHADRLHAAGLEVAVFSAQDCIFANFSSYLGVAVNFVVNPPDLSAGSALLAKPYPIILARTEFSLDFRWRVITRRIAEFAPDAILFVGLMSPMVWLLRERWPVVGLNVHSLPPLAPIDVWLSPDHGGDGAPLRPWGDVMPPMLPFHHPYRVAAPQPSGSLRREQFGDLTDAHIVLITVGARLPHEIGTPWAERMVALVNGNENLRWLLVGGEGALPASLCGLNPHQVITLPHRQDLPDLLRISDLYVNPPRPGGGFSVAEAMALGLPALSLSDSDGGDKVGPDAITSLDGYFERLIALVGDARLRSEVGSRMQRRYRDHLDLARALPSLLAACEQAIILRHGAV